MRLPTKCIRNPRLRCALTASCVGVAILCVVTYFVPAVRNILGIEDTIIECGHLAKKLSSWSLTPPPNNRLFRNECYRPNDEKERMEHILQEVENHLASIPTLLIRQQGALSASLSSVTNGSQPIFQPIDGTVGYVISGFLDVRDAQQSVIKAFVLLPFFTTKYLYCHIKCKGHLLSIKGHVQFISYYRPAHDNCVWQPYILHCPIPVRHCKDDDVTHLSVTSSHCTFPSNLVTIRKMYPLREPLKKIGICLNMLYDLQEEDVALLIQFVELAKMFHVSKIYLYDTYNVSSLAEKVVNYYVKQNVIERHSWKIPPEVTSVFYFSQVLQNNDCIYRHMSDVEYLLLVDLDEMLIPLQHQNWPELLRALEVEVDHRSVSPAGYSLSRLIIFPSSDKSDHLISVNGNSLGNSNYVGALDAFNDAKMYEKENKPLVRPSDTLYVSVHSQDDSVNGLPRNVQVDVDVAAILHFKYTVQRVDASRQVESRHSAIVQRAWSSIVPRLRARMEKVFKDFEQV